MDRQVADTALVIQRDVFRLMGYTQQRRGTQQRDIRSGIDMLPEHLGHRQIQGDIAPGEDHIVLTNVLQVIADTAQCVHIPLVLPPGLLGISEGGQDPQAAMLAAEIPVLAGPQMIQQRLIALVNDNAYVRDPGVDIIGQHKVDQAVAPAEGERAGIARAGQLPQVGVGPVSKQNSVEIFHA